MLIFGLNKHGSDRHGEADILGEYSLRISSMAEIAVHFQGKSVSQEGVWGYIGSEEGCGVLLDDGSVVLSVSRWGGQYSEQTPDVEAHEPAYYICEQEPGGQVSLSK